MFSDDIFRANDIRGRYPHDFDLPFTKDLAFALCQLSKQNDILKPKFLIGRDARLSSPEISQALKQELKNQGAGVSFIGLAPSPLCYFLLYHYSLTACIVVTASHNPKDFNGFKILFHKKWSISKPIAHLRKIISAQNSSKKTFRQKGYFFKLDKEKPYIHSLKKEFSLKSLPFVLDTGNGALGPLAKKVYSALGLKPKILFSEPNGHFPHHHPDPTIEKNLFHLKKALQKGAFKFGLGFDGDGDRLTLVNKKGEAVLGDELAYLFLKFLKSGGKKSNLVLADVKCSDGLFDFAKKQGFKVKMTKSGHGLIRAEMEKTGACLALEFSGHIFFNDRKERGFDDALYASLRLIEILNSRKTPLESLLPKISSARTGEIRLTMPHSEVGKKLAKLRAYLKKRGEKFKALDGIRLSRKEDWFLCRSSKTQSALTMRFESSTKRKLQALKTEISKVIDYSIP